MKWVEEVDTVVVSVMNLNADTMVLDNSDLGWLGEPGGSELRGAGKGSLRLLDFLGLSTAAESCIPCAVPTSESQNGNSFLKLTVKNVSHVM